MKKYELMAIADRLTEAGVKRIRRVGHSMEFDHIKDYVRGDDYRTINWKATARKTRLMVNHFDDEKSQQVYSVIDIGRVMKMPFEGMSLLDYAINSSLVISSIAMHKQDKAGLVTFSNKVSNILPADRQARQMQNILEILYNQKLIFLNPILNTDQHNSAEDQSPKPYSLYTNFESLNALQRQLAYLRRLAQAHLVIVIFFINTELFSLIDKPRRMLRKFITKLLRKNLLLKNG